MGQQIKGGTNCTGYCLTSKMCPSTNILEQFSVVQCCSLVDLTPTVECVFSLYNDVYFSFLIIVLDFFVVLCHKLHPKLYSSVSILKCSTVHCHTLTVWLI